MTAVGVVIGWGEAAETVVIVVGLMALDEPLEAGFAIAGRK